MSDATKRAASSKRRKPPPFTGPLETWRHKRVVAATDENKLLAKPVHDHLKPGAEAQSRICPGPCCHLSSASRFLLCAARNCPPPLEQFLQMLQPWLPGKALTPCSMTTFRAPIAGAALTIGINARCGLTTLQLKIPKTDFRQCTGPGTRLRVFSARAVTFLQWTVLRKNSST